jgi:putative membrane protein
MSIRGAIRPDFDRESQRKKTGATRAPARLPKEPTMRMTNRHGWSSVIALAALTACGGSPSRPTESARNRADDESRDYRPAPPPSDTIADPRFDAQMSRAEQATEAREADVPSPPQGPTDITPNGALRADLGPSGGTRTDPGRIDLGPNGGTAAQAPPSEREGVVPPASERPSDALTDPQIAELLLRAHSGEIALANFARTRTRNPNVRDFAETMLREHTNGRREVERWVHAASSRTEATDASNHVRDSALEARRALTRLRGQAFDRAYVDGQITMHQELLQLIDSRTAPGVADLQLRDIVTNARGSVAHHLEMARATREGLPEAEQLTDASH